MRRKYSDKPFTEKERRLITRHIRLVFYVARKMVRPGFGVSELVQEGTEGLRRAIQKYDPKIGRFSTYAVFWIRQSIFKMFENQNGVIRIPPHSREWMKRVNGFRRDFLETHLRDPYVDEIALALHMSQRRIKKILLDIRMTNIISLDAKIASDEDKAMTVMDSVPDNRTIPIIDKLIAEEELYSAYNKIQIVLLAKDVTERQRDIFIERYGLNDSFKLKSLKQVGIAYRISPERVRQITNRLCDKMSGECDLAQGKHFVSYLQRIQTLANIAGRIVHFKGHE